MLNTKKSTHYCYLRYLSAISVPAKLWWINRHYELDSKGRMEEIYGKDRIIQYQEGKRCRSDNT